MKVGEIWEPKIQVEATYEGCSDEFIQQRECELESKVRIRGIVGDYIGIEYIDLGEDGRYDILHVETFLIRYKKVYDENR